MTKWALSQAHEPFGRELLSSRAAPRAPGCRGPPSTSWGSTSWRRTIRPLRGRVPVRRHALFCQLMDRLRLLGQVRQAHAAQYARRLGKLDVVIADDLHAIAPRVAEIEEGAGQRLDARLG